MKRKRKYICWMLAVCMLTFVGAFGNINTAQAATFENGYYCETVQGTLKAEYEVDGQFGEYNQTTNPDDRCDNVEINVSESLEFPVSVNIRRNLNSAEYRITVDTTSQWSARKFCHGDAYEYEQGSWINCGGTTYLDFTADGTHDLSGINTNAASEQTVDLTYKGCTYSVDVVFDDNRDWIVDWYNITATLNRMTLTFTYPPFPEYTIQYDPNGGSGYMPSETVRYSENFALKANAYTKNGYVFKGWAVIREADGAVFCDNRGWTPFNECQPEEWHIYGTGEQYAMDTAWFGDRADGTFTFCAQWEAADRFVNYMGNEADNKEDYYQSYSAASENRFNKLDFKKTGYTAGSNWVYKDQFMNTAGSYAGDGTAVMPGQNGLTTIRTKCGGRYDSVDINAASTENGANVQLWDCVNGNAQMFAFQYVKTENNVPYWVIKNNYSGKVLDVNGTSAGANVQQYAYHGGDNQLWTLKMAGNGYFYICSKLGNCTSLDSSSLVLDLWGYSTDNGTNITISGYHGGDNQQWYLWDNTINLSAEWTNSNYKVDYNADGGTLLDENGNETTDTVRTYEYDRIYNFLKAKRAYTVSYETNGGTATIGAANTNAQGTFNGWNEQLTAQTSHGEVKGWDGWSVGIWNWAAYYNGNPDLLRATNNVYDTMWAILHYREHGISENRQFSGASYWLPALSFKNLTANGGTVNVKADYTNGSVTLPDATKEPQIIDGVTYNYTFDGWYSDSSLNDVYYIEKGGKTYTPTNDITLYAKFTENKVTSIPDIYIDNTNTDLEYDYKNIDVNFDWARETEIKTKAEDRVNAIVGFFVSTPDGTQINKNDSGETITFTDTTEGTNIYTVKADNAVGNSRKQQIITHIDRTAPEISGVQNEYGWTNRSFVINVTVTDNLSGVKNVILYDSDDNELHSSTGGFTYTFSNEQDAQYKIVAQDNVGNTSEKEFTVKIDKTPPEFYEFSDVENVTVDGEKYGYNDTDTLIEKVCDQEHLSKMDTLILYPETNPSFSTTGTFEDDNHMNLTFALSDTDRLYDRWICIAKDKAGNVNRKIIYFGSNFTLNIRRAISEENY